VGTSSGPLLPELVADHLAEANMKTLVGFIALAFTCAFAGQEPATPQQRPPAPGAKPASPDAPFIGSAAMDGLAEVEHGRLALGNASSPQVKRFAQRMINDHQKAGGELKGLASRAEVTLATRLDDQHQATQDDLAQLTGAAFDQAYMAHMVEAHLQAVALFQQEVKNGQDRNVKEWAARILPTLQEHVRLASSLNATLRKAGK
jgi:putative membrane protein